MQAILEGIRVLDLSRAVSGPFCTQMLGDMGAEIIKVELPEIGDSIRALGPYVQGESAYYMNYNRNKKSITLALDKPESREILKELIMISDVLVENFKPGFMKKIGFSYETVHAMRPELVYVSITGFGQDSPWSALPAFDSIIQGMSGLMSLTGEEGDIPARIPAMPCDHLGGLHGAIGVLAALFQRQRSGMGQHVDIAMLDAVLSTLENAVPYYLNTGENPPRTGNKSNFGDHPLNVYKTKDGYLTLQTLGQAQYEKCMCAMGLDFLAEDPALQTSVDRRAGSVYMDEHIGAWMAEHTTEEARAALKGIPCGPVYDMGQVLASDHVRQRGVLWELEHEKAGTYRSVGCPVRFSETPARPRTGSPCLGEHNRDVICSLLGHDEVYYRALEEKGVL